MATENKSNKNALKQGALAFVISFIAVLILVVIHFLYRYYHNIFERGSGVDFSIILEMIFYAMAALMTIALLISVLVMAIVYFRQRTKQGQTTIKLKKTLLCSIPISFFCFMWIAFVSPIDNLRMYNLLFDIRMSSPEYPFERSNVIERGRFPATSNFFEINREIDRLKSTCEYELDMRWWSSDHIIRWQMQRVRMVNFPFQIFILFYLGMFLGVLSRKQKLIVPILVSFFVIAPTVYYLEMLFEHFMRTLVFTPNMAQFLYVLTLAILTFGLFLLTKNKIRDVNYSW